MTCFAARRANGQAEPALCDGKRVDAIIIESVAPSVSGLSKFPFAYRIARQIHTTTRESVIRNFLLMKVGGRCTELRRAESERIMRAQTFLADASVTVVPSDSGGVTIQVRTVDEVSIIIGGAVNSGSPYVHAVKLGNSNIDGTTSFLTGSWRDGQGYRDGFGGRFQHQQIFGRPYVVDVEAERGQLGDRWHAESAHPFYTDLQRVAWRVRAGESYDFITFPTDSSLERTLPVDRKYYDLGGVVRIGPPGRLTLLGASLSGDDDKPANSPSIIGESELTYDPDPTLRNRFVPHRMARANLIWGVRDLTFKSRTGVDALTATQDVPAGFQLGTMFGRSLSVLGSHDDDIFLASDLYLGIIGKYAMFRVQLRGEGRRANNTGIWDGILTSGRVSEYVKTNDRHTLISMVEWSGGWHQRIPFNLTLRDRESGIRAFGNSRLVGGRRVVGRMESRWVVGPVSPLGDLGVAAFADAGKLFAGDVPFGSTSPFSSTVGFSILAAVPKKSARLWRMDVAVAMRGNPEGRRVEVRVWGADNTRFFFREPEEVARARELTVPSSVFRWP